jgi:hypothetical protein
VEKDLEEPTLFVQKQYLRTSIERDARLLLAEIVSLAT